MALKKVCPCDLDNGNCPFDAENFWDCDFWCSADPEEEALAYEEHQSNPKEEE